MSAGKLGGQDVFYNHEKKVLRFTIREPFYKAGEELGWEDKSSGIGINKEIIAFVKRMRCHLIIHMESEDQDFWLDYNKIMNFMNTNKTEYQTPRGVWVTVLSTKIMPHFRQKIEA